MSLKNTFKFLAYNLVLSSEIDLKSGIVPTSSKASKIYSLAFG